MHKKLNGILDSRMTWFNSVLLFWITNVHAVFYPWNWREIKDISLIMVQTFSTYIVDQLLWFYYLIAYDELTFNWIEQKLVFLYIAGPIHSMSQMWHNNILCLVWHLPSICRKGPVGIRICMELYIITSVTWIVVSLLIQYWRLFLQGIDYNPNGKAHCCWVH